MMLFPLLNCRFLPPDSPWKVHLLDIDPKMTNITVSGLTPARTYQFRVCAVNQVGKGQYSIETSRYRVELNPYGNVGQTTLLWVQSSSSLVLR